VRERLACVVCGTRVVLQADGVRCGSCATVFERVNGVPVMVAPAERAHLHGVPQKKTTSDSVRARWRRLCTPPSPSEYAPGHLGVAQALTAWPIGSAILEVGSGVRRVREDVLNLEIDLFENVDIVANATRMPFLDETFDLVICEAVLEHVPNPQAIVSEINRVLRPGGQVYVEVPFLQGFHADPHDYQRYTLPGLRTLLAGFEPIRQGVALGPSSALAWMLREYLTLFAPGALRTPVAVASAWLTTPVKYLDRLVGRRPGAERIAAGMYFWGLKASR
jgi:SAM-dependent methyltransferase